MTDTALRDRLAKVLASYRPRCWHGLCDHPAREWANRCLTDANVAIALIEEHGPDSLQAQRRDGHWYVQLYGPPQDVGPSWEVCDIWDADAPAQPEAICRAFVAWREAQEVTA